MTDFDANVPPRLTLREQEAAAERELERRLAIYFQEIAAGRRTAAEAAADVAPFRAIRNTLRILARYPDDVREALVRAISREKSAAEIEEIKSHPAVAAVLSAFEGATIGSIRPIAPPAPPDQPAASDEQDTPAEPDPNQSGFMFEEHAQ